MGGAAAGDASRPGGRFPQGGAAGTRGDQRPHEPPRVCPSAAGEAGGRAGLGEEKKVEVLVWVEGSERDGERQERAGAPEVLHSARSFLEGGALPHACQRQS